MFGTVWAYFMLHDIGIRKHARMDWWGNILFAVGLISVLVGITYGLLPYGGHPMGWTNPWVLTAMIGGVVLLAVFVWVETKVAEPLFNISLFRIRPFAAGNVANLALAMSRGGMQFMLIIWLQGIWLPLHGYSIQPDPVVGGHLPGAADRRLPAVRAAVRHPVGQVRCQGVHRGRVIAGGSKLPGSWRSCR